MKIKIVRCEDMELGLTNFENEINEFIKDKKIIDIKYKEFLDIDEGAYNCSYGSGVFGSVMIMYED